MSTIIDKKALIKQAPLNRKDKNYLTGQAIILAAGESSRFWPFNFEHKSLFKIMGKPLIFYLVKDLQSMGIKEVIIVQNPEREIEKALIPFSFKNLKFVTQEKPLGTGDALLGAEKLIKNNFFLMNAERLDASQYLKEIIFKSKKANLVILAAPTKMPHLFGILKVRGDKVLDIIEKPQGQAPSDLKNIGFYLLPKEIFGYLKKTPLHPYSLIKAIVLYAKEKEARMVLTQKSALFLKFPWDLFRFEKYLFDRFLENKIADSAVAKNVTIKDVVQISDNVIIGENTVISGPCFIGENCRIGSNNVLRGPVNLENDVVTGAFTEIKNCLIQKEAYFHSGYFGDSIIGQNCRFGAGLVTANKRFDRRNIKSVVRSKKIDIGFNSFGIAVGNNSRFGIHSRTMPGVLIGLNCIIGPSALVSKNIEDNTFLNSL